LLRNLDLPSNLFTNFVRAITIDEIQKLFQGGTMSKKYMIPLLLLSLGACSYGPTTDSANTDRNPSSAAVKDGLTWMTKAQNEKLWSKYCSADGGADSADVPTPNYENELVKGAVNTFKVVVSNSLYPYPAIKSAYGLSDKNLEVPKGVSKDAHIFLTYLCGEFRDRASMVEAKLTWLSRFNKLQDVKQPKIPANEPNVWAKMSANAYRPFLDYSHDLWFAREAVVGKIELKPGHSETGAVDGLSVCTTKYIFNEIAEGRGFTNLKAHDAGFKKYSADCSVEDKEDYYDFRGDSNFKPNSPEGNGMIWYANHIASNCKTTTEAKPIAKDAVVTNKANIVKDADCEDYFTNPFRRRWQAARAGLASWMMHSKDHDAAFKDDYSPIQIWPHRITDKKESTMAFSFKVPNGDGDLTGPLQDWLPGFTPKEMAMADFNFNSYFNLGTEEGDAFGSWERLRDAMNRHTNWYQSQWDDGLGGKNSYKEQAYSPFVASSYEPSESDQFTFCGITVPCPPDGFKHWMFVFRVKGKNWFKVDNLVMNGEEKQKVDFSYMWFDETSLGTTGLADKEHAWDRMGTALEEELAGGAILYLHNITDSGEVSNDNLN
jgi:hypothetical protein